MLFGDMKTKYIILSHITFWILAVFVQTLPVLSWDNPAEVRDTLIEEIFLTIFCVLVFYCSYFFIARVLIKRKIFLFLLIYLLFIFLFTLLIMRFYPPVLFMFINPMEEINYTFWFFSYISHFFVFGLWGTMFRFTINWFIGKQREKELEKQNIFSELNLLRSQINPHFLFNTLNNINSFIFREPDKTSFGISKLSDIMKYMLYDANADKVKLSDEINYIRNYIDLQKLRIKETDYIRFEVDGDTDGLMIPPMLLIPFVENAFKHGKKNVQGPGIFISLTVTGRTLDFRVKNYLLGSPPTFEKNGGFGLKNIKRRLELIYGYNYMLVCDEQDDMFVVSLNIEKL
jgi:two-component system, LytTR family, sensor kinase